MLTSIVLVLAVPGTAFGSSVGTFVAGLKYEAADGEQNNLQITYSSGEYTFTESTLDITAGSGCRYPVSSNHRQVICDEPGSPGYLFDVMVGDGDDFVFAVTPRGTLMGGAGDDTLSGGNVLYGDLTKPGETFTPGGNDLLLGNDFANNLVGDGGNDRLYGQRNNDQLMGGGGDDQLYGGDGIDVLAGDNDCFPPGPGSCVDPAGGNDTLVGGPGDDRMDGELGSNTVDYAARAAAVTVVLGEPALTTTGNGSAGEDDSIVNVDHVTGGRGADHITGNHIANRLDGGPGPDELIGGDGPDAFIGGDGEDEVTYRGRTAHVFVNVDGIANDGGAQDTGQTDNVGLDVEIVTGGGGDDALRAGGFAYRLNGGAGDDELTGGDFNEVLNGGAGNDTLDGGYRGDDLHGGDGIDTIDYSGHWSYSDETGYVGVEVTADGEAFDGNFLVDDGGGEEPRLDNVMRDVEKLIGTPFNDVLVGSSVPNTLAGGGGDDSLMGGGGADILNGGPGAADLVSYAERLTTVVVTIDGLANDGNPAGRKGAGEGDNVLTSVEQVAGGEGADTLTGNGLANKLFGNSGADTLTGGGGVDELYGNANDDRIFARDAGVRDVVRGGPGSGDVAQIDTGVDDVAGIEIFLA